MWIRIQDQRLKDSQIVEYKGRSKGMASGLYTIEIKYGRGLKYFGTYIRPDTSSLGHNKKL